MRRRRAVRGHLVARPACAVCGAAAASVELVPPGALPSEWRTWPPELQKTYTENHDPQAWRFLFEGIDSGNGLGDDVTATEALRYATAFARPLTYERVHQAGLYDDAGFCASCRLPYCSKHWDVSSGGYGRCPRGHGKSLDPHWSPSDYE